MLIYVNSYYRLLITYVAYIFINFVDIIMEVLEPTIVCNTGKDTLQNNCLSTNTNDQEIPSLIQFCGVHIQSLCRT